MQAWISRRRSIISHSVWKQRLSAIRLTFSHSAQFETALRPKLLCLRGCLQRWAFWTFKAYKVAKITPFSTPVLYEHRLHVYAPLWWRSEAVSQTVCTYSEMSSRSLLIAFKQLKITWACKRDRDNNEKSLLVDKFLPINLCDESDVTYGQVWWPILGICALRLTHPKCTHTAVNTHTHTHTRSSRQPFMLRRLGSSWGSFDYESESLTIRPRLPPPHVSTGISSTPIIYNYFNLFFSLALALAYANYVKWFRFIL